MRLDYVEWPKTNRICCFEFSHDVETLTYESEFMDVNED